MTQDEYPQITQADLDQATFRIGLRPISQTENAMSDLERYIEKRKVSNPEFAEDFDRGYAEFKRNIGSTMPAREPARDQEDA